MSPFAVLWIAVDVAAARSPATLTIVATTVRVALITLKSFVSIVVIAIGLVFAIGALFATLLPTRVRARV